MKGETEQLATRLGGYFFIRVWVFLIISALSFFISLLKIAEK